MIASDNRTYTTKELADLAGVSSRTLRYYDQIDCSSLRERRTDIESTILPTCADCSISCF